MKSSLFNVFHLAPFEQSILKRYPSISKAWFQYKWQECIDLTTQLFSEYSPVLQDSYEYVLNRIVSYCHYMLQNYEDAYDYAMKVLDDCIQMKDPSLISRTITDIGRIHKSVEDTGLALEFFKDAIKKDQNNVAAISEMCLVYIEMNQFEHAECSLNRLDELIHSEVQEYPFIAFKLLKIFYNIHRENTRIASKILEEIEADLQSPNYTLLLPIYHLIKGIILFDNRNYCEADENFKEAEKYAEQYQRTHIVIEALLYRSDLYKIQKDYKNAYFLRIKYNELNNQISNSNYNQRLSILKKYFYRKQNEKRNQQVVERAVRLTTIAIMSDNMIYEITPHLHSIHMNIDSILFWDVRNSGYLPSLFLEEVKMIREALLRTEHIIEQMNTFWNANDKQTNKQELDLNECILSAITIINNRIHSHNIRLEMTLETQCLFIKANQLVIEQVVINLINNAIQALDKVTKQEKLIKIETKIEDKQCVLIVSDNATGFIYDTSTTLFDPFNPVRSQSHGMGLGLMIVKNFLDRFQGTIQASNNTDGGATIKVRLPFFYKDQRLR